MRPSTSRGPSELMSDSILNLNENNSNNSLPLLNSIKKVQENIKLEEITEEKKLNLLLGKEIDLTLNNIYMREDYCGACGVQHPNYSLLDTYSLCESCLNCLRDHSHLRDRFKIIPQDVPLEICFATYGN